MYDVTFIKKFENTIRNHWADAALSDYNHSTATYGQLAVGCGCVFVVGERCIVPVLADCVFKFLDECYVVHNYWNFFVP